MNEQDKEYDLRQFKQMLASIDRYKEAMHDNHLQDLQILIANLDFLRSCLRGKSEWVANQFDPSWATLEEVYAVLLDLDHDRLDKMGSTLVDKALNRIESVIKCEIGSDERESTA